MLAIGQVIGACVGQGTHKMTNTGAYRIPMGLNLVIVLILFLGIWLVAPESPRWLMSKGRDEQAIKALERINADAEDVQTAVEDQYNIFVKAKEDEERWTNNEPSRWTDLFHGTTRRKFLCAVGILIAQQIGGVQFIFSYTTTFLGDVGIGDPFTITIIVRGILFYFSSSLLTICSTFLQVDIVEVIGVICSFFLVNRFGRRPLLLITSAFMTAFLIVSFSLTFCPSL